MWWWTPKGHGGEEQQGPVPLSTGIPASAVFINNRGIVLTRERLLDAIWDVAGEYVNDNTLTVYIKRLREKIEDDPTDPKIILTVRGTGYKVDA